MPVRYRVDAAFTAATWTADDVNEITQPPRIESLVTYPNGLVLRLTDSAIREYRRRRLTVPPESPPVSVDSEAVRRLRTLNSCHGVVSIRNGRLIVEFYGLGAGEPLNEPFFIDEGSSIEPHPNGVDVIVSGSPRHVTPISFPDFHQEYVGRWSFTNWSSPEVKEFPHHHRCKLCREVFYCTLEPCKEKEVTVCCAGEGKKRKRKKVLIPVGIEPPIEF
jgi:hypothetical protein